MADKPAPASKGPSWYRKDLAARDKYADQIRPISGIGTTVVDMPDGQAINDGSTSGGPSYMATVCINGAAYTIGLITDGKQPQAA